APTYSKRHAVLQAPQKRTGSCPHCAELRTALHTVPSGPLEFAAFLHGTPSAPRLGWLIWLGSWPCSCFWHRARCTRPTTTPGSPAPATSPPPSPAARPFWS